MGDDAIPLARAEGQTREVRGVHQAARPAVDAIEYLPGADAPSCGRLLHLATSASPRSRPGDLPAADGVPLRGVSELTILLDGQLDHRDSLGNRGRMTGPAARLVAGGAGIVTESGPTPDVRRDGGELSWITLRWAQQVVAAVPTVRLAQPTRMRQGRTSVVAWAGPGTALTPPGGPQVQLAELPTGAGLDLDVDRDADVVVAVLEGLVLIGAEMAEVPARSTAVLGEEGTRLQLITHLDAPTARVLIIGLPRPAETWVHQEGLLLASTADELAEVQAAARSGAFGSLPRSTEG